MDTESSRPWLNLLWVNQVQILAFTWVDGSQSWTSKSISSVAEVDTLLPTLPLHHFACWWCLLYAGDVQIHLALAQELDRHGPRVRLAMRESFKGFASQVGLTTFDIRDDQLHSRAT